MPDEQIRVPLVHATTGLLISAGSAAVVVYAGGHLTPGVMMILGVLGLVAAIGPAAHFHRNVSAPVRHMRDTISRTQGEGDLALRLDVAPTSLLASAFTAYNGLITSLQGAITRILFTSTQVAQAAARLIVAAGETADGSERQIAVAREVAAGVAEVATGVNQASGRAEQTVRIAQAAHGDSVRGTAIVLDASAEIGRIAQSVEQSAQVVAALGERSKEISGIVNVIHAIADQTNLLALNAAIEAARAGEQGRGFAVVADEVRKLAERTTAATGEISTVIAAIQSETASAITAIKAGSVQATNGAELARKAAEALDSINASAQDTLDNVSAIAAAMSSHSLKAQAIAGNVDNIIGMAEQNARNARGTLDESAQLSNLATRLEDAVNSFKPRAA